MKRMIMTVALVMLFIGSGGLYAQEHNRMQQQQNQQQQNFKAVDKSDIPSKVKKSFKKQFKKSKMDKAYVNDDDIYKLELKSNKKYKKGHEREDRYSKRNKNKMKKANHEKVVYYNKDGKRVKNYKESKQNHMKQNRMKSHMNRKKRDTTKRIR